MKNILEINNVSKQYRLGLVGTGSLGDDINRWWHRVRGKEDPYLIVGEANDRSSKANSDYVWALRDIDFSVKQGEVLGIIGKNGAGKSTLLKILSRVTGPTTGSIQAYGRIASLLEVGTGFHPELTGRENIFLNGAILGMTRPEIKSKFDEIVDFSGCERYIDTPVKRYSSGMYVRLAFAVAAHLEPEILIVDEVLAVGDAEFQKKAIGKMKDVSRGQGRTVLFVSHNMAAVKSLCTRAILLKNGKININDDTDTCVNKYLKGNSNQQSCKKNISLSTVHINEISIRKNKDTKSDIIKIDEEFLLYIDFDCNKNDMSVTIQVKDEQGAFIFGTGSRVYNPDLIKKGNNKITCKFPSNYFNVGTFYINILFVQPFADKKVVDKADDILCFTLNNIKTPLGSWMGKSVGPLKPILEWY